MWLTKALHAILMAMVEAERRGDLEAAEIVCDGACWLGDRRIHPGSVRRLLTLTAIRDVSDTTGCQRYVINDMGRSILRRPAIIQELSAALRAGGSYTIREDRIVPLVDGK